MKGKFFILSAMMAAVVMGAAVAAAYTPPSDEKVNAAAADVLQMRGLFAGASDSEAADLVVRLVNAAATTEPANQRTNMVALVIAQTRVETAARFAKVMELVVLRVPVQWLETVAAAAVRAAGTAGASVGNAMNKAVRDDAERKPLVAKAVANPLQTLGAATAAAVDALILGQTMGGGPGHGKVLPPAVQYKSQRVGGGN